MSSLSLLSISSNCLYGAIPDCIDNLSPALTFAYLNHNRLSGSIPSAIGELSNLQVLNLASNRIHGAVPTVIAALSTLFELDLHSNRLTGRPTALLCNISSLVYLIMANNSLDCAPWCQRDGPWNSGYSIPRCPDHQDIALNELNERLGVAKALSKTVTSTTLNPRVTVGSGIPPTLIQFPNAFEYRVTTSLITAVGYNIVLCSDPMCRTVMYSNNGKKAFKASLGTSYFYISLRIDPSAGLFVNPIELQFTVAIYHFSSSSWTFGAPPVPGYGNMSYATGLCQEAWSGVTCRNGLVVGLSLSALGLHGPLPPSIGLLTGLTSLILSSNRISGDNPPALGLLTNLVSLELASNRLNGTIPTALLALSRSLVYLDVSYNQLSHSLPSFLSSLNKLRLLYADGNLFVGEVSSTVCDAVKTNNLTLTLTESPHLTCYQRECWSTAPAAELHFDTSLTMCVPTQSPTGIPTSAPTAYHSHSENSNWFTNIVVTAVISVLVSLLVLLFVVYLIYSLCFRTRRLRKLRLDRLPVHRALLTEGMDVDNLLEVMISHIGTANTPDYDGDTALTIIYCGNKARADLSTEVVAMLLEAALPIDLVTKEPVPPSVHKYGWAEALHQSQQVVKNAVRMIIDDHPHCVLELAHSLDSEGRRCIDIANEECKDMILRKLWLYERYELEAGAAEHRSATSVVVLAVEHIQVKHKHKREEGDDRLKSVCENVALKFMRNREQYRREVNVRANGKLDDRYVLGIRSHYDGAGFDQDDRNFQLDAAVKGFGDYPYCVVMDAGSTSLKHFVDTQHVAGRDWSFVRDATKEITKCLRHMHRSGVIHGDLKGEQTV